MSEKGYGKISDDLINKIRNHYIKGFSCQNTADKFGVGKTTVRKYVDVRKRQPSTKTLEETRKSRVEAVQRRRLKIKGMAVDYKGGKCKCCGYNNYQGALEFHHLDPNGKDFSIGQKGHCRSWEKVKVELDKCVLVCANCHREIHGGLIEL